ncbi:hypothetical protein [Myroides sp. LJL110]
MRNNYSKYTIVQGFLAIMLVFFMGMFSGMSQTNMTKIKDGTLSGSPVIPGLGAVLELESVNKGFLTPRLTTQQRDAIDPANRADGLMIFNTTTGCFNYWSKAQDNWLSMCGTPPPAVFDITTVQCGAIRVSGNYKQGDFLTGANFLTVPVTVSQPGTYQVMATSENGYYFTAEGTFPSAGSYTLILAGVGTPAMGYDPGDPGDTVSFSLNNKPSSCEIKIPVEKADVSYQVSCNEIEVQGDYMIGMSLDDSHKLILKINVQSAGYWNISTNTTNGISFRGSGTFDSPGAKIVELVASGTPVNSGVHSFTLTTNSDGQAPCQGIEVTVKPLSYQVDCSVAEVKGVYKQDVTLLASNTVTISVDVKATGSTSITTNTVAGVYFTSGPLQFNSLGVRDVVLTGVGTPNLPGIQTYTLASVEGMMATCSFDVEILAQDVAYTMNCSTITLQGSYAPNTAMKADNKMIVTVNVQYPGAYSITSDQVNGVTFSGSGTFNLTGTQEVELQASGIPLSGGIHRFTLTSNSAIGTITCNKNVEFIYNKINVLGLGGGVYQPGTSDGSHASKSILQAAVNFGPNGTMKTDGIAIFNGGINQGNTVKNLINNNKIDVVVIGFNYIPDNNTIAVLEDFVKNKKGVLIHSQENGGSSVNLINAIDYSASTTIISGAGYINSLLDVEDPIFNGPFGNARGKKGANDVNNPQYVTGVSSNFIILGHQDTNTDALWMFRHNTLGYLFVADAGWTAGNSLDRSNTIFPAAITAGGVPITKAYYGGNTVYNSILYANAMAWAIQYVQNNTDKNYIIP